MLENSKLMMIFEKLFSTTIISCVICISNEVEYLEEGSEGSYQSGYIVILSDLCDEKNVRQNFVA